MNKQELIDYCESLKGNLNKFINGIDVNKIIKNIEQLDEPQKPVVPQFVGDWYEEHKDDFDYNLWEYLTDWEEQEPSDFKNWINDEFNTFQILVNMHQFGYTVEKEKRYRVSLKNGQPLLKAYSGEALYFSQDIAIENYKVTRKELEDSGFGEVFDSPLFEVEEVE